MTVMACHRELSDSELSGATKEMIQVRHDLRAEFAKLLLEVSATGSASEIGIVASRNAALRSVDARMASLLERQGI